MKILSINTANKQSDLAIMNKDELKTAKLGINEKHSESAMVAIDGLLSHANIKVKDLDAVAVVVGPGSFTGIRIGISLALGFSTVYEGLKLIEITAFEFLKQQYLSENKPNKDFVCVFNALSGKYFIQSFDKNAVAISQPEMVEGTNFLQNFEIIVGLKEENLSFLTHNVVLQPETLAAIAKEKFENGDFGNNLMPLYLRKSQAEDMLDKKDVSGE